MTDRPALFFLHGLGCSSRLWDPVINELGGTFECIALDLPGHGSNARSDALTVEQMVDWLIAEIATVRPTTWGLVGHSLGGKIVTIAAARAERGVAGLAKPIGVALVASSPLGVEPMDETRRREMIGWAVPGPISAHDARTFVEANTAGPLPSVLADRVIADVQRVNPVAWLAWLQRGSLEDWSASIGRVELPAVVVAGADDGDLGPDAQRRLTLPHVAADEVRVLSDAAHLIPLEQPAALATLITQHFLPISGSLAALAPAATELINSDRVSARTRGALLARWPEPSAAAPVFTDAQRSVLRVLLDHVIPQRGTSIDLVARIETQLATGHGDGWRFAELPIDVEAWRRGLDTLDAAAFTAAPFTAQRESIGQLIDGTLGSDAPGRLSAAQMTLWFEDVRAEAVRTWLSHPATLTAIGYDGFANGGDGIRKQGYLRVGVGESESWQLDLSPVSRGQAS